MDGSVLRAVGTLALLAPAAQAVELGDFKRSHPEVWFDLPGSVVVNEVLGSAVLAPGERLVAVDLPVSVLVNRGDVGRVQEVVVSVDGAGAGLTVHDYSPATRLESEFTGDIEEQSSSESQRHFEASLGGRLPIGGAVAQITPGASLGRSSQEAETRKRARRAPKRAVVVSGPINGRRGVLFKFRPYSQTTLEGEHTLRVTFVAPAGWEGGSLDVDCQATGRRKVLFVNKPTTWSQKMAPVTLRLVGKPETEAPLRHTAAKPMLNAAVDSAEAGRAQPMAQGPTTWKPRKKADPFADAPG